MLLVEDGALRTQEGRLAFPGLADVENLDLKETNF
jgi:hypothetical protein